MGHRPTIMDVARKAGVSKVTVSYVLNGQSASARISDSTSQKVLLAARELGYSPNAIARMMVTKRCSTLGVVFQKAQYFTVWSTFTSEVMHGICQATVASGYDLMLHTGSLVDARSEADALTDGRVDGVLVLRNQDDATLDELLRRSLPVVLFFTHSKDPSVAFVDADNFAGGQIATEHLIGLGHKRIAMVKGDAQSTSSNERFRGYQETLHKRGLPFDPSQVVSMPDGTTSDIQLYELLSLPNRPTAIFCWSDDTAASCLTQAALLGIRVPEDLSLVGFDSLAKSEQASPPLTSVAQPVGEIAKAATEMLIAIACGEVIEHRQLTFPVKLDVRASTGPAPRG